MNNKVEYVGKDLEAMDFAVNYHRWILSLIKPHLGEHLVEVGAGTGSFSEFLLETEPKTLSLVEPSEMFNQLKNKEFVVNQDSTQIITYQSIFSHISSDLHDRQSPDTIIYINVLEHIEDDEFELELVNKTLSDRGKIIIFVPALNFLFSEFDKQIGHFRRYTKSELIKKCKVANFEIKLAKYFDISGILPWFIKYKLLKSLNMESGAVQLYDRSVVPITKFLESMVTPPIGKNLLLIGEKI